MRTFWLVVLTLFSFGVLEADQGLLEPIPIGQKAVPSTDPALASLPEIAGLPRVMIIGDSISIGYFPFLRTDLQGKANLVHPPFNGGSTALGLRDLDKWIGTRPWDVIVFNFGLHDLKYVNAQGNPTPVSLGTQAIPPPQYEANLQKIVDRLKKTHARLIFVTTTPVPAFSACRVQGDEVKYNAAAKKVMEKNGVEVEDLCALVTPKLATLQIPQNVHFKPEGYQLMAQDIAARIESQPLK